MATTDRTRSTERTDERDLTRSSQHQPARRETFDPMGFSPGEFFANPFSVMRRMHDEMDRMFADAFGRQAGGSAMAGLGSWAPPLEVSERDNEICVCAELPGLRPEDVKIEVTGDALVIEGERKQEREQEQGGRWQSERRYGKFYRAIPLPEGANTEQARAEFKNGELRVTVPVARPQSKRRQVPISGASGERQQTK